MKTLRAVGIGFGGVVGLAVLTVFTVFVAVVLFGDDEFFEGSSLGERW